MARPLIIDPQKKTRGEVVTFRLAPQQRAALSKRAKREKVSVAELLRSILTEAGF
jgi:predicted HicB family RNase H-like nuclease